MSTATSVQETFPRDGANNCHVVVVCENPAAHNLAREVCARLMAHFKTEPSFTFSFWEFRDLEDPVSAHWAADALERADIILLSLRGYELTPTVLNWLDACALSRVKTEGALALLVASQPGTQLAVEALVSRMQFAAHRLRMDFLPLVPPLADIGIPVSPDSLPAFLHETHVEPGGTHWGLNE